MIASPAAFMKGYPGMLCMPGHSYSVMLNPVDATKHPLK